MTESHKLMTQDDMVKFMVAGKATFTLLNTETGNRFTYLVKAIKEPRANGPTHFVSLMNGSCNESSFTYIGQLYHHEPTYSHGRKAKVGEDAPSARTFKWLCQRLLQGTSLPAQVEFWHEGKCGRCGRKLTDPTSIELGFGPECRQLMLDE